MNRFAIAVILAWVAGFVDAAGFITLSHVFTSHMSGNTIATGAHLGAGEWKPILHRLFPIPVFVAGVFIGSLMGAMARHLGFRRQFAPSFTLESLLLVAFVGLGLLLKTGTHPLSAPRAYPFVGLLAAAMGLQNATLRRAGGIVVRTTFITGMLVNMAEQAAVYCLWRIEQMRARVAGPGRRPTRLSLRRSAGKRALKFGLVWCGMFAGAVSGGLSGARLGTLALLIPLLGLGIVIARDLIEPIRAF